MLLWRLLRKNIVAGQLLGYVFATLIGLTIVLFSIQFYTDIKSVFSSEKGVFGRDFLVVSKKVSMLNTLKLGSTGFTESELENMKKQSFVKRIAGFTSSSYQVYASASVGKGKRFSTLLFFESVPNEFLDINSEDWQWDYRQNFIPIVLPKSYLTLYNFGFAPGQGLPQLSESTIGMLTLNIEISGREQATFQSRIVGFTDRVNTILVPQSFMDWANDQFGVGKTTVSRVIIEPYNLTDPAINTYFSKHNYDVANDKAAAGEASSFLRTLIFIVMGVGVIITALALGLMLLSINLLIQKNHTKIENLSLMGYTTRQIALPYQSLVILLNIIILSGALALVNHLHNYYLDSFSAIRLGNGQFAWSSIWWGISIVVALSIINITWIWLKVKEIRK
jgi:uncharacterized membrane protein YciS (DUF1049 family)